MNSDFNFSMTEDEAKDLWGFLNARSDALDMRLLDVLRRLESGLWDRLSIDEMALIGRSGGHGDG